MNDIQPSDRTSRVWHDIESKIREMENAPQGLDVLYRALKLFDQVDLGLNLRIEGSQPQRLRVRNNAGTFHELEFQGGIYTDHYRHGPEEDAERFASLERLSWWIAERTIPRIFARAYSSAEREGKLLRAWNSDAMGVSINAIAEEYAKEFEHVDGVWRRKPEAD